MPVNHEPYYYTGFAGKVKLFSKKMSGFFEKQSIKRRSALQFSGGDDEHHGAAQLVLKTGQMQYILRRLGFHNPQSIAVGQQAVQIGGQRAVVLCNRLSQEAGFPLSLAEIVVHGEVVDLSGGGVHPVLGALGGKDRVLHGEDQLPAAGQAGRGNPQYSGRPEN